MQSPGWKKGADANKKSAKERKEERKKAIEEAMENCNFGDTPTLDELAGYLGVSKRTARDRINEHGGYLVEDGMIYKKGRKKE